MREIKFRAWDVSKELMMYDDKSAEHDVDYWDGINSSTVDLVNYQFKKPAFIWMQFTGLKDKNGKDIYEGDILSNGETKTTVVWAFTTKSETYGHGHFGQSTLSGFYFDGYYARYQDCEVIGNIYENPELLTIK